MRSLGIKLFIVTICALLLTSHMPAMAHANLVSSYPKDGAVLSSSPKTLNLRFSGALTSIPGKQLNRIKLLDIRSKRTSLGEFKVIKNYIHVPVLQLLKNGGYRIQYRVVADDGHILSGEVKFSVRLPE